MGRHLNEGRRLMKARGCAQLAVRDAWHGRSVAGSFDYLGDLFSRKVSDRLAAQGIKAEGEALAKLTELYADWFFMLHGVNNRIAATEEALKAERSADPAKATAQDERMLRILAVHMNQLALREGLNLAIHRMVEEQYLGEGPEARRHARIEMNSGGPGFAWPKAKPVVKPVLSSAEDVRARSSVDLHAIRNAGGIPWFRERRRLLLRKALGLVPTSQERFFLSSDHASFNAEAVAEVFDHFEFEISLDEALERLGLARPEGGGVSVVRESKGPTDATSFIGRMRRAELKAMLGFELTTDDLKDLGPFRRDASVTIDEVHLLLEGSDLPITVPEALAKLGLLEGPGLEPESGTSTRRSANVGGLLENPPKLVKRTGPSPIWAMRHADLKERLGVPLDEVDHKALRMRHSPIRLGAPEDVIRLLGDPGRGVSRMLPVDVAWAKLGMATMSTAPHGALTRQLAAFGKAWESRSLQDLDYIAAASALSDGDVPADWLPAGYGFERLPARVRLSAYWMERLRAMAGIVPFDDRGLALGTWDDVYGVSSYDPMSWKSRGLLLRLLYVRDAVAQVRASDPWRLVGRGRVSDQAGLSPGTFERDVGAFSDRLARHFEEDFAWVAPPEAHGRGERWILRRDLSTRIW